MKKQYYEIRTVPKYNKKINRKKKEAKQKALRHIYMTTWLSRDTSMKSGGIKLVLLCDNASVFCMLY